MDEQDRAAVAVRGVLPDTRLDQAGQRGGRILGRLRWPQRGQRRRPGRQVTESREPLADLPALIATYRPIPVAGPLADSMNVAFY